MKQTTNQIDQLLVENERLTKELSELRQNYALLDRVATKNKADNADLRMRVDNLTDLCIVQREKLRQGESIELREARCQVRDLYHAISSLLIEYKLRKHRAKLNKLLAEIKLS